MIFFLHCSLRSWEEDISCALHALYSVVEQRLSPVSDRLLLHTHLEALPGDRELLCVRFFIGPVLLKICLRFSFALRSLYVYRKSQ